MSGPKLNNSTSSPMGDLKPELRAEINANIRQIEKRMTDFFLIEQGVVRQYMLTGVRPQAHTQLAFALRDADAEEWDNLARVLRQNGNALPESASSRAGFELKHRWKSIIRQIEEVLPPGADVRDWVGFVPLAKRMMELEGQP